MTGATPAIDSPFSDLDIRQRRIRVRAWRRGMREMDLLLGAFVDSEIEALDGTEIAELEALLDVPDSELFSWLCGVIAPPALYDTSLFRKISAFHSHDGPIHR
jgi:antitoxin CptB